MEFTMQAQLLKLRKEAFRILNDKTLNLTASQITALKIVYYSTLFYYVPMEYLPLAGLNPEDFGSIRFPRPTGAVAEIDEDYDGKYS